ncbi:hypothetical protein B0H14DRAFT_1072898 [Mycena olivaceomarginata]|nr:hypothetical protein B0H14DRAFT_1072898 [Mycena olivaceomarginata]
MGTPAVTPFIPPLIPWDRSAPGSDAASGRARRGRIPNVWRTRTSMGGWRVRDSMGWARRRALPLHDARAVVPLPRGPFPVCTCGPPDGCVRWWPSASTADAASSLGRTRRPVHPRRCRRPVGTWTRSPTVGTAGTRAPTSALGTSTNGANGTNGGRDAWDDAAWDGRASDGGWNAWDDGCRCRAGPGLRRRRLRDDGAAAALVARNRPSRRPRRQVRGRRPL